MQLGFIGLGKMGKNMVLRLLEHNIQVVAWNRSSDDLDEVAAKGATPASSVEDVAAKLEGQRFIWLMLPNGAPTDEILGKLLPTLRKGDVVIDGANSLYVDTLRRAKQLEAAGIELVDIGVSGGPGGARNGACLMIGGAKDTVTKLEPVILALSAPGAFAHFGPTGSGHFAKMVHNGIEYGMMQAIAEGAAVLQKSPFGYYLAQVFHLYNQRSVIESRLVEWTENALKENPTLADVSSTIAHTGEGEWTINAAKELGVDVPVIETSYQVRVKSGNEPESFRNKVVSALRGQFGGHATKKA